MIPTLNYIGFTVDVIGKLLIAFVTVRIHVKHFKSHHVESKDVRADIYASYVGIILMVLGYFLRLPTEWPL